MTFKKISLVFLAATLPLWPNLSNKVEKFYADYQKNERIARKNGADALSIWLFAFEKNEIEDNDSTATVQKIGPVLKKLGEKYRSIQDFKPFFNKLKSIEKMIAAEDKDKPLLSRRLAAVKNLLPLVKEDLESARAMSFFVCSMITQGFQGPAAHAFLKIIMGDSKGIILAFCIENALRGISIDEFEEEFEGDDMRAYLSTEDIFA